MSTAAEAVEEGFQVRRYQVRHSISDYTYPVEARVHSVRFDDEFIHIALMDGRLLSVPLWWIPSLFEATPDQREKYQVSRNRTVIIWDPAKCAINDELRIGDYLGGPLLMPPADAP